MIIEPSQLVSTSSPNVRLSPREIEILRMNVAGNSNIEIAAALYLSPNTVKTYVRSIFNKLGVDHRLQAAVIAVRNGMI